MLRRFGSASSGFVGLLQWLGLAFCTFHWRQCAFVCLLVPFGFLISCASLPAFWINLGNFGLTSIGPLVSLSVHAEAVLKHHCWISVLSRPEVTTAALSLCRSAVETRQWWSLQERGTILEGRFVWLILRSIIDWVIDRAYTINCCLCSLINLWQMMSWQLTG